MDTYITCPERVTYTTVLVPVEDLRREGLGVAREVSHLLLGLF